MSVTTSIIFANLAVLLAVYGIAMPFMLATDGRYPQWPSFVFFAVVWLGTFIGCWRGSRTEKGE